MLDFMRKYARSWFAALAIGAIAVVFIFWGIGTFRSARFESVAQVNDASIRLPDYLRAYHNLVRSYQDKFGGELTEEILKNLRLKEQALNQLIDQTLILQAAQNLGIVVGDDEVRQAIRRHPAFSDAQGFNEKRYYAILSRNRISPADFEAQERQNLLTQKTVQLITSFAKVSEAELQELYRLEKEAVDVDYVVVNPAKYLAAQTASEADLTAYYEQHQEEFRQPEKAQVRYLLLRDQDFLAQVKLTPEDIKDFYNQHSQEFSRPKVITVSQIYLPEPPKATAADRQRLQAQALSLVQRAQRGENFAALVKAFSQDAATRNTGGHLGVVSRGQQHAAWEAVAFGLKPGEIGLAHTPKGFYILRLDEINESEVPSLDQIKDRLEKRLKDQQARTLAQQQAETLRKEMATASFTEVAAKHRLAVKTTPFLAAKDPVPDLGPQSAFNQAALSLKPQEISKPIPLGQGLALLQGIARQESRIPPLTDIQPPVRQAVLRQKAATQAAKEAKTLLERLTKGEAFAKLAAQAGFPVYTTGYFTRAQGFPSQPQAEVLTTAAFQLSKAKPYLPEPLSWQQQYYLLRFLGHRAPPAEEFAKARDQLAKDSLEYKRQLVFAQWLAAERQRAKIKVYDLPS